MAARREQEETAHRAAANVPNDANDPNDPTDPNAPNDNVVPARSKAKATVIERGRRRPIDVATADLGEWIAEAMHRGATVLYLRSGKAPSIRVDGKIETLATDPLPLAMFERAAGMMTSGQDGWRHAGEWAWTREMAGAGTVNCHAFSYGHGGGFIVQLPVAVAGLDQQVPRHIRAACETGEGLVLISAPFEEDVMTMVGAVVAWNSRRRAGFVVAFGSGSGLQNIAGDAFVSERPIPSSHQEMAAALQNALKERPDLIVIAATDTLPAPDAIVAAASGRLVVVGVVARTAPRALEVLMKDMGANRSALAAAFRGACSWRGFRRPGSQRVVIADSLVASERVSAMIEAGDIAGLQAAQFNRDEGMRALDPALAAAVTRRKITLREAAACAVDRKLLIGLVRRRAREARAAERQEQIVSPFKTQGTGPKSQSPR
jgi:Tfp pilus assembly pilus retraction ATPase PilT